MLIMFSGFIIFYYYSNGTHVENFDWYLPYFLPILGIYSVYKFFTLSSLQKKIYFSPAKIAWFFSLHLLLLSVLFFSYTGDLFWAALWNGLTLFFKIWMYWLLPISFLIIQLAFWKKILGVILEKYKSTSPYYKTISGIWFGFFSFVFILSILWMLWAYNIISVAVILGIFIIFSYKELLNVLSWIWNYKIKCTNHNIASKNIIEQINPKLLSIEFFFIVITLILSINLISIFRPFPIGWDDLGAYMNQPQLMANAGFIGELGSMMSWQTFTGIWYMLDNPTLAFFLNNVWWFLSVIIITLIVSEIFKNKRKTFIHLPLLAATLFISMPMIIFQQAKDMKLDAGLFFMSIIALYMLFEFYNNYKKIEISKTGILKLFLVIWLLLWFTFTIKFTSLLLLSAVFWILFYTRLWILGFLWYLSLYFAIFTAGWLWKMMNVIALDTTELRINFSIISFIIWITFLITARFKTQKRFRRFIPRVSALLIWILLAIAPWWIQNISSTIQSWKSVWVSALLWWYAERFDTDYSKIYSKEELVAITKETNVRWLSSSGTTTNEDFWRYFWYEKWINNYVKLPWNLTMQNNQGGEFTTIWFLFLALLPTLLLFLPFRKREYALGVYGLITFEILLFIIPISRDFLTSFMASMSLPYGYLFILLLALVPLTFFIPTLQKKELTKLFQINLVFAIFYSFLWGISAFGIVWYGIVMYFNFILMIVFWAYYLWAYNLDDSQKKIKIKLFWTLVFSSVVWIYMFMSVFPHSFNNLKTAAYREYKLGTMTVTNAPFRFHREYLPILFNLNIAEDKQEEFLQSILIWEKIKKAAIANKIGTNIEKMKGLLVYVIENDQDKRIQLQAKDSINNMYLWIQKPKKEYKNTAWIYRIGTFLKYHISENNKRLLEDSLVESFNTYIYDKSPEKTIERIKKLGINYLLVDLNAATIDKDPRHNLTKRYEDLLKTFTSQSLDLIDTDSMCLRFGLEEYKKDKEMSDYILRAGVNYDSFSWKELTMRRQVKQQDCYEEIIKLIEKKKVDTDNYSYLLAFVPHIEKMTTIKEKVLFLHKYAGHGSKVLFKIQ